MDKTSKTKEEKKPGFKRLESHRKRLILNASAVPPFNSKAATPTEFYNAFLSKKSQFKAKDMRILPQALAYSSALKLIRLILSNLKKRETLH